MMRVQAQCRLSELDSFLSLADEGKEVSGVSERVPITRIELNGALDMLLRLHAVPAIEVAVGQGQMGLMIGIVERKRLLRALKGLLVSGPKILGQREIQGLHLISKCHAR